MLVLFRDIFQKDIYFFPEKLYCCKAAAYNTIKFRKNSLLETNGWKKQMSAKDNSYCVVEQGRLQMADWADKEGISVAAFHGGTLTDSD